MLYTQLFDRLFRLADSTPEYGGALPVHVRLMMDEFANVALPKNFKNILAVCRSRNISCDIILQSITQIKSMFKDDWEGLTGNCDTAIFLGGNDYATAEYFSKRMGKQTERTKRVRAWARAVTVPAAIAPKLLAGNCVCPMNCCASMIMNV